MSVGRSAVMVSSMRRGSFRSTGVIALAFQQAVDQPYLRWRIVDDENFFLDHRLFSGQFSAGARVHVSGQFGAGIARHCCSLV